MSSILACITAPQETEEDWNVMGREAATRPCFFTPALVAEKYLAGLHPDTSMPQKVVEQVGFTLVY